MFIAMIFLVFTALVLHLDPGQRDFALSLRIRLMRLAINISIAIFIPVLVEGTFGQTSKYELFLFHPVFMFATGTIFALGLQLLMYGKLNASQ
jgi:hypothetical protein